MVRLPELTGTMQVLSQELTKACIIEEMVDDVLPNDELIDGEEDEAEGEVDKVLGEILHGKLGAVDQQIPQAPLDAEREEADREAELAQMRGRLEARVGLADEPQRLVYLLLNEICSAKALF